MGKPELAHCRGRGARRKAAAIRTTIGSSSRSCDASICCAVREASVFAARNDLPAAVLAKCIDVLTDHAERLPDDQFESVGDQVLRLAERYDHSRTASS